jgi:heme/copper-type cytochrome/quinol oxidase subunit 3
MSLEPKFTEDVSELPNDILGPGSLTWWGTVGFMVIEGVAFGLVIATYFFLMNQEQQWPPDPWKAPDWIAGTLFTVVIVLSEIPNMMIRNAANAHDVEKVRKLLPLMVAVGLLLFVIRAFEFPSLNISWYENAYGSVIWVLLLLHTAHLATDWVDSVVLAALVRTPLGYERRRMIDVDENAMYWRFVWLTWLPIYLLLYWVPRWV